MGRFGLLSTGPSLDSTASLLVAFATGTVRTVGSVDPTARFRFTAKAEPQNGVSAEAGENRISSLLWRDIMARRYTRPGKTPDERHKFPRKLWDSPCRFDESQLYVRRKRQDCWGFPASTDRAFRRKEKHPYSYCFSRPPVWDKPASSTHRSYDIPRLPG